MCIFFSCVNYLENLNIVDYMLIRALGEGSCFAEAQ